MSTVSEEILTYLDSLDLGVLGEDLFALEDVPPKPDRMIMVSRTGTWDANYPSLTLTSPTIQVIIRGGKGELQWCEKKAELIDFYLHRVANKQIVDARYAYINNLSGPSFIGLDETMRPSYSVNYTAIRSKWSLFERKTVQTTYSDVSLTKWYTFEDTILDQQSYVDATLTKTSVF